MIATHDRACPDVAPGASAMVAVIAPGKHTRSHRQSRPSAAEPAPGLAGIPRRVAVALGGSSRTPLTAMGGFKRCAHGARWAFSDGFMNPGVLRGRSLRLAAIRASLATGAWMAVSAETFRPAEIKHDICVRSFHRMRSFHVVVAWGTAVPREPGMRPGAGAGPGPRGRRYVDSTGAQDAGVAPFLCAASYAPPRNTRLVVRGAPERAECARDAQARP